MQDTMTICDVTDCACDGVREAIACEPANMIYQDDGTLTDAFSDRLHEIADDCVPVYNHHRAACLADDPSLAYVDDPGLLGDEPDVWSILGVAIYERASAAAYEHAAEVADFARDFARGYRDALCWSERPDSREIDAEPGMHDAWGETDGDEDVDPDAEREIWTDAVQFVTENWHALEFASHVRDAELLGHDYALTRNGHGAGYWDRDELTTRLVIGVRHLSVDSDPTVSVGGILTDAAERAGSVALFAGDDGALRYAHNA